MIRTNKKKTKGPQVSVPAAAKPEAPLPGRSSFAARVKKTRRRSSQSQSTTNTHRSPTSRPTAAATDPARNQPKVMSRQERLAAAKGIDATAQQGPPPGPLDAQVTPPAKTTAPTSAPSSKTTSTTMRGPKRPPAKPQPTDQTEPEAGYVAVGRVHAPHGLHGEVKVTSLTENPDRFAPKAKLWAGQQQITVTGVREASGFVYLTIKGFNDRTSVEKFRNTLLQVPESELPKLEEGEYYRFQLIGLKVFDREGGALGEVAEIIETGATDVYRVAAPDKPDLLLAAMPDVVLEIDIAAKRMTVDPPDWR